MRFVTVLMKTHAEACLRDDPTGLAVAALTDKQALLEYVNDRGENWPHPEIHAAIVELLEAVAMGEIQVGRARKAHAILSHWLDLSKKLAVPVMTDYGFAGFEVKSTKDYEALFVLSLWLLLCLLRSSATTLEVKRCEECLNIYFDESRGKRGRFCRAACRVKNFRNNGNGK